MNAVANNGGDDDDIVAMMLRDIYYFMRPFACELGRQRELEQKIHCIQKKVYEEFAGLNVYVSGNKKKGRALRIVELYDGHNVRWLARRFDVSERTVYRYLREYYPLLKKEARL